MGKVQELTPFLVNSGDCNRPEKVMTGPCNVMHLSMEGLDTVRGYSACLVRKIKAAFVLERLWRDPGLIVPAEGQNTLYQLVIR